MIRKLFSAIRFLTGKPRLEREMDAELRFHIEREIEEHIGRGVSPQQARAAVRRRVGGIEQIKEECREARAGRPLEETLEDIRYGMRILRRNPGFTSACLIILALGVGVNTAIFSVVYGVFLRPLPYQNGGQLVVLHQQAVRAHVANIPFSAKEVFDYRDRNHTLESVVEHHSMSFLLLGDDRAERVQTGVVSANFFEVLGATPLIGRTFRASDEAPGADAVLVLSYKYWQDRHGGDPTIVGRIFQMNNRPHTVIGVLPPVPQYPVESDVYMPTSHCPTRSSANFIANRQARMMTVFGRLKPGVPLETAQADLSTLADQLQNAYPDAYPAGYGYGVAAAPLRDELTRRARTTLLVLLGAAGFVLLIACANVANLLLSHLLKLEPELAVRSALGATRVRLMRQLLAESLLLSCGGGLLGIALAQPALILLVRFAERFTPRAAEVRMDAPVLLFTTLISVLTGLVFGLAPAFLSSRRAGDALRQAGGRATTSRRRLGLRAGLVVAQASVSLMLLIGAGLMARSFLKLQQVDPGFNPDHLLTLRMTPNFSRYTRSEQLKTLSDTVLLRIRSLPGVESAGSVSNIPLSASGIASGPGNVSFEIEGRPASKGELAPLVDTTAVSASYFDTIRQPLVRGRTFTDHDNAEAPAVAVINETMANHRWPAEDPAGKRVTFDQGKTWTTIVGVVGDVKEYGLERAMGDEMYLPDAQAGYAQNLVLRTAGDPMALAPLVRSALHAIDPQLAVDQVETVERLQRESMASPRVTATLLGLFAVLALVISAGGIAAVMALAVRQRTHELGVRMALGASSAAIVGAVVRQGLVLGLAGVAAGIGGAMALTRWLSSLLYGVSPTDLSTFGTVSLVFLLVAMAAAYVPARQVTRIDPLIALRHE